MNRIDGVIEAVRYRGGRIELVRAFERRGPAFADSILLDRAALIARLEQGRRFVTGKRKAYMAGTFDVGEPVTLVARGGDQVVTTLDQNARDRLEGVPRF